ncbi:MAG: UDP-4-amino-4,6-dideoxy-N-acetyl-beta-L-altrosamine transaminase [Succinivibrio sp.]|nr:UDP-4-amino-4,6-dideoxy-N-acetyl-beta-L-altrosamine transaminase [Succinivibrio sp.]
MIPYSTQTIDEQDEDAIREVLYSPFLTTGPTVTEFEDDMCSYTHASYAVAVNSCTSALHLAMLALGVGQGDLVYVSAISFVASANCALYAGAEVDFVDVDPKSGNMDLDKLEQMLKQAKIANRLPKAVVAVHLAGRPLDLERLKMLKDEFHFYLIEDAAHATGAVYFGQKIGCGLFSDVTVFSFHPVKIITTAEGGMCLTNNEEIYMRIRALSSHGIIHDKELLLHKDMPAYYYEQQDLGFNYRMSDIQAALGISQLSRIEKFLALRRQAAIRYHKVFRDSADLGLPECDSDDSLSSWHLYQVAIPDGRRDEIYQAMRTKGIGVQVHYLPIYRHPYYQKLKKYEPLPGAETFFKATLSLPLYPSLSSLNQQFVSITLLTLLDRKESSCIISR